MPDPRDVAASGQSYSDPGTCSHPDGTVTRSPEDRSAGWCLLCAEPVVQRVTRHVGTLRVAEWVLRDPPPGGGSGTGPGPGTSLAERPPGWMPPAPPPEPDPGPD